jgi:Fur family ferric uptake transcriptional regulator/Fur family peroxide stress response transcriptional regulator
MEEIEGFGLTKQRRTVLRVIQESDKHLTANEVFVDARRLLSGISFATVYNSLNYLKNKGLIGEIKLGMDANLYDRKLTRHDHALCNKCGMLVDMELTIPRSLLEEAASRSKFKPDTIELTLRGLCPECSVQEN